MRIVTVVAALAGIVFALGSCDFMREVEEGVTAEVPVVPVDLPIYPTDISLQGFAESIASELDDWGVPEWLKPSESTIQSGVDSLEDKLKAASVEILQPGVLSVSVKNQVTDLIRQGIEFTKVGVKLEISNDTKEMAACPAEFKIYLGEASLAESWDESVSIEFADPKVSDGAFIVKPGETVSLSIDDVPHIAAALNNAASIGIGYKAIYRMTDTKNGADVGAETDVFGKCVLALSTDLGFSTDSCPSASELVGWHLTVHSLSFVITAKARFDVPDMASCKEFADSQDLGLLGGACP
ncbi:MAG: hypothetical protein HY897_20445 [Deltaproteobacteria bacterium]|nr:hypothetical protein [Deltaproteobacteria bacterium]